MTRSTFPAPIPRHVFTDGTEYYVAESIADIPAMRKTFYGEDDPDPDAKWEQVPDEKIIKVGFDDQEDIADELESARLNGLDLGQAYIETRIKANHWKPNDIPILHISAAASWWAKRRPGFLCSTEY